MGNTIGINQKLFSSGILIPSLVTTKLGEVKPNQKVPPGYVVDNPGNSEDGIIYFLRQVHYFEHDNDEERAKTSLTQNRILIELCHLNPRTIFLEGVNCDGNFNSFQYKEFCGHRILYSTFGEAFTNGPKEDPTQKQMDVLYNFGAGLVYAYLNPYKVRIKGTIREHDQLSLEEQIKREFSQKTFPEELIFQRREQLALAEVKSEFEGFWWNLNHAASNPDVLVRRPDFLEEYDNSIALVFGRKHNFARHCTTDFNPTILSKDFSESK